MEFSQILGKYLILYQPIKRMTNAPLIIITQCLFYLFAENFLIIFNAFLFLEDNNLLTPYQLGFRPNDSCSNQLLPVVHSIYLDFDHNPPLEVSGNFVDIFKAFDKGLLYKRKSFGISRNLLIFFS